MFNRPRCRDWSPLATQQLRLRNLVGIIGQNITCSAKSQLYFTLHLSTMSAPFFTSEKIDFHGSGNILWPEINCAQIMKSTAKSICVRVWEHIPSGPTSLSHHDLKDKTEIKCSTSTKNQESICSPCSSNSSSSGSGNCDKMIFVWGVYFSGLILLTKRTEAKFYPNSLVFQMHGDYFVSAESLTQDSMRQQLRLMYQLDQEAMNTIVSDSSTLTGGVHQSRNVLITTRLDEQQSSLSSRKMTSSCDIFSNSNSKILTKKSFDIISGSNNDEFDINSPRSSRSCSPIRNENLNSSCLNIDTDLNRNLLEMLKKRYVDKNFFNTEIRPSYSLMKLLKLQEIQRRFKRMNEDAHDIIEKICMKSAFCLNLDLISSNKGYLFNSRQRNNPSMGRTLNRLLYQQEPVIKPEDILKGQELKRQIETAHFRCRILQQQRNKTKLNMRQLEKKLCDIHDSNIEHESFLMSSYRNLAKEKNQLTNELENLNEKQEILVQIQKTLIKRRYQLCSELKEIYPIEKKEKDCYTIANIYLPNTEKLTSDIKLLNIEYVRGTVSPLSLSAALGYVAHVVQMCSIILNLPLRNPIKHEGSRSRILDIIKEIPNISREFPLYIRSSPSSKQFLYAIFLLNQNITQLNFQVNEIKSDIRMILPNLLQLIEINNIRNFDSQQQQEQQQSNAKVTPHEDFSCTIEKPTSSVNSSSADLNSMSLSTMLMNISKPIDVVDMKRNEQRTSRSVGSYSDEQLSMSPSSSSSSSFSPTSRNKKQLHSSEPILSDIHRQIVVSNFNENENI